MHRLLEKIIIASRWLLAPFYFGLMVALVALLVKAGQHVVHIAQTLISSEESEVILSALSLIDLTLDASLVLIVIFSGYENFVRSIRHRADDPWPEWLAQIDFTGLKVKLLSTIVAISAIQLLRVFMAAPGTPDRELIAYAAIHVVFVISTLLLILGDRWSEAGQSNAEHGRERS